MTGPALLVSVRDRDEVTAAAGGGAAIIDVKDPAGGSLGRPAAETLAACAAAVPRQLPWTLAAGELLELPAATAGLLARQLMGLERQPAAVKFGLSGSAGTEWFPSLARIAAQLPVTVVPVAYADARRAAAVPVEEVIDQAAGGGFELVLVDTFDKRAGGGLLELASVAEITGWLAQARAAGLGLLLAGRLELGQIPIVAGCQPDAVAVRSAVCRGGRLGRIDRERVAIAAEYCRRATSTAAASAGQSLLRSVLQKGVGR